MDSVVGDDLSVYDASLVIRALVHKMQDHRVLLSMEDVINARNITLHFEKVSWDPDSRLVIAVTQ